MFNNLLASLGWSLGSENISFETQHQQNDQISISLTRDRSASDPGTRFMVFDFNNGDLYTERFDNQTVDTVKRSFTYQDDNNGNPSTVKLIAQTDFLGVVRFLVRGKVDISTLDLSDFKDVNNIVLAGFDGTSNFPFGTASSDFYAPSAEKYVLKGNGTYNPSLFSSPMTKLTANKQTFTGALGDLPSPNTCNVASASFDDTSPPGSLWWQEGVTSLDYRRTKIAIDLVAAADGDQGITNLEGLGAGTQGSLIYFFENSQRLIQDMGRQVDVRGADAEDCRGQTSNGFPLLPPDLNRIRLVHGDGYSPFDDYRNGWNGLYQHSSDQTVATDNEADAIKGEGVTLDDAANNPGNLFASDGIIGALEAGIDLSGMDFRTSKIADGFTKTPLIIPNSLYDQILTYTNAPSLQLKNQDRPRLLEAFVDNGDGTYEITVKDPNANMQSRLGTDSIDYRMFAIRFSGGGVNGRYSWDRNNSSNSNGSTTLTIFPDNITSVDINTKSLDQHSTAALFEGKES